MPRITTGQLKVALIGFWFVIVAAIALIVPYWHYTDFWLLTDVLGFARDERVDDNLVPIDLGQEFTAGIRPRALALLEAICQPTGNPADGPVQCNPRPRPLPDKIVLDVLFLEGSGDPALATPLANVILALRDDRVSVYAAEPGDDGGVLDAKIRNSLRNALGHTRIGVVPFIATGFAWYERVADFGGAHHEALPLVAKNVSLKKLLENTSGGFLQAEAANEIIPLGPHDRFEKITVTAQKAMIDVAQDATLEGNQNGQLGHKLLLIGNSATDIKTPGNRTGFELVAWAISNGITDPDAGPRFVASPNTPLMIIVTLVASALAAILYPVLFRHVRTRRFGYSIAYLASIGATALAVFLLEAIMVTNHNAFAQLSLAAIGTLTAAGCGAGASAADVKHQRDLEKLVADATVGPEDQFDVFISYARDSQNANWVIENVYETLRHAVGPHGKELKIFFDRESIEPGSEWYPRIVRSIVGSRCFLPVYSRGYFQRWFCRDELEMALLSRRDKPNFIVPITRIGYRLPRRYASSQTIDARSASYEGDLVRAVMQLLERSRNPAKTYEA